MALLTTGVRLLWYTALPLLMEAAFHSVLMLVLVVLMIRRFLLSLLNALQTRFSRRPRQPHAVLNPVTVPQLRHRPQVFTSYDADESDEDDDVAGTASALDIELYTDKFPAEIVAADAVVPPADPADHAASSSPDEPDCLERDARAFQYFAAQLGAGGSSPQTAVAEVYPGSPADVCVPEPAARRVAHPHHMPPSQVESPALREVHMEGSEFWRRIHSSWAPSSLSSVVHSWQCSLVSALASYRRHRDQPALVHAIRTMYQRCAGPFSFEFQVTVIIPFAAFLEKTTRALTISSDVFPIMQVYPPSLFAMREEAAARPRWADSSSDTASEGPGKPMQFTCSFSSSSASIDVHGGLEESTQASVHHTVLLPSTSSFLERPLLRGDWYDMTNADDISVASSESADLVMPRRHVDLSACAAFMFNITFVDGTAVPPSRIMDIMALARSIPRSWFVAVSACPVAVSQGRPTVSLKDVVYRWHGVGLSVYDLLSICRCR